MKKKALPKFVKKYKFEYFFGERYMVFVKFPSTMTVNEIIEELFWAKTWHCKSLFTDVIVQAIVKPHELARFNKQNRKRIMEFYVSEDLGSHAYVKTDKNSTSIFEI